MKKKVKLYIGDEPRTVEVESSENLRVTAKRTGATHIALRSEYVLDKDCYSYSLNRDTDDPINDSLLKFNNKFQLLWK